jgi:[ribosomal protein S18]-alanine N-acetyltransferase
MSATRVPHERHMSAVWKPNPVSATACQCHAMTLADVDAVLRIEQGSYSHPWSRGNFVDSLAAGYHAQVLTTSLAPARRLVAYFVAMAGVDELHLLNITVAPEWQNQGHGSRLLDGVQALARQQRLASLWLEVRIGNARARAFYRRHGFAEVGLRRAYYPAADGREDAVVMSMTVPRVGQTGEHDELV